MKLLLALGAGLFVAFLGAFAGPLGGSHWDQVVMVAMLLFLPVGLATRRWAALLLAGVLVPAAWLADAVVRPGVGLDSTGNVPALPVALFLTPVACLLLLVGTACRKLASRSARAES